VIRAGKGNLFIFDENWLEKRLEKRLEKTYYQVS